MRTSEPADRPAPALQTIARLVETRDAALAAIDDAVKAARAAGYTWEAIAEALGVTRQAARERYGAYEDSAPLSAVRELLEQLPVRRPVPNVADLGDVSDEEVADFGDWLMRTGRARNRKVASDYRSRLRRALAVDLSTLGTNVRADVRTALRAFAEYRAAK